MDENGLPSRLAGEIAEMIAVGDIAPGSHLSTQQLAVRFAVSRTPVREALGLLAERGAVLQQPNRGYFACKPRPNGLSRRAARQSQPADAPAAYYQLGEDWLNDAIEAEITEQRLMERYGLTKGQLSAILARASADGWMERKAGYGWRFLPVAKTPEALDQIYRFRTVIEPAALLEPTFRLDRSVADRMRALFVTMLDGAIETWPPVRLHAIGVEFHEELARMSGNPMFHQSLVRVNRLRKLLEHRSFLNGKRAYDETREHLDILDMLVAGDVTGASYQMRHHLGRALTRKRSLRMGRAR